MDASAGGSTAGSSGMGQGGQSGSGGSSGSGGAAAGSAGLLSGGTAGASGQSGAGNAAGEHGDASAGASGSGGDAGAVDASSGGSNGPDGSDGSADDAGSLVCQNGLLDCDRKASTGCEVDPKTDKGHCGDCNTACSVAGTISTTCNAGLCKPVCDANHLDCDGDGKNGCEVDIKNDPKHCGSCAIACGAAGTTAQACTAGVCKATCDATHLDCNADGKDGCEIDGQSDAANCGTCKYACSRTNAASTSCVKAVCTPKCNTGHGDCSRPAPAADNGCETDLSQPASCGACGHDCQGGTCDGTALACNPVAIVSGLQTPWSIALDATNMYFTQGNNGGSVRRQPLAGGTITVASSSEDFPEDCATDGTYLYWCDALYDTTEATIRRQLITDVNQGTAIVNHSTAVLSPCPIALQGNYVYWTDYGTRKVFRARKDGTEKDSPTALTPGFGSAATTLAVDATTIYYAYGAVFYGSNSIPETTELLVNGSYASSLAIDSTYVYFQTSAAPTSLARLAKTSLTGTPQIVSAVNTLGVLRDQMATDATYLYFATNTAIYKVPKAGGQPIQLTRGTDDVKNLSDLAVNANAIYWTNEGNENGSDGSVMKLAL